ncbi:NUP43 family protein [Megaselia abdita]
MEEAKVNGFFISEKISRIRWVPEELKTSEKFITGSWGNSTNYVKCFKLVRNQFSEEANEFVPKCNSKVPFKGDITGLEFLDPDKIVVSSSDGTISILSLTRADIDTLSVKAKSNILHQYPTGVEASCTSISIFEKDIASVGEDGCLHVLSSNSLTPLRSIENADSCTITTCSFVNSNEILTGNRMGGVKIFDIRSEETFPQNTLYISCEDDKKSNYVSCLAFHPTQKHIIFAGSEEGSFTVWDLRQPNYPASYLSAHTSAITEIAFHKSQPTKLFTASENGELWQWTQNTLLMNTGIESQMSLNTDSENVNPWLNGERAKHKINVTSLFSGLKKSINTFDTVDSKIICGCDNESVYLIDSIL